MRIITLVAVAMYCTRNCEHCWLSFVEAVAAKAPRKVLASSNGGSSSSGLMSPSSSELCLLCALLLRPARGGENYDQPICLCVCLSFCLCGSLSVHLCVSVSVRVSVCVYLCV